MTQFTIVTINWNNLAGLQKTYQSVASQTYRNFRWIVVDGASNDGAVEWLQTVKEPWAEITSEPDNGLYDAMNKGLEKAVTTPGYTLFLNSGDWLYDERVLERVAQTIEQASTAPKYVYGDFARFSAAGRVHHFPGKPIERLFVGMPSSHQAMYFENELLKSVRFRDQYKLSADYCMLIEFINQVPSREQIVHIAKPLCVFDNTGVSVQRRFEAIKEDVQIRRRHMKLSAFRNYGLYTLHYLHAHVRNLQAALENRTA